MPKALSVSLTKGVDAIKLHPRNFMPQGQATVPYGALIEPMGSTDRGRERFKYLGELYECKRDVFLSATGGAALEPEPEPKAASAPEAVVESAPGPVAPRLEWKEVNSSHFTVLRSAVPGGWLVALQGSVIFVSDSAHQWDGGSVA